MSLGKIILFIILIYLWLSKKCYLYNDNMFNTKKVHLKKTIIYVNPNKLNISLPKSNPQKLSCK